MSRFKDKHQAGTLRPAIIVKEISAIKEKSQLDIVVYASVTPALGRQKQEDTTNSRPVWSS